MAKKGGRRDVGEAEDEESEGGREGLDSLEDERCEDGLGG